MADPNDELRGILAQGGVNDPALKRAQLQAMFGPNYAQNINEQGNFVMKFATPSSVAASTAPDPTGNIITDPLKRGAYGTAADLTGGFAAVAGAVGLDSLSETAFAKAKEFAQSRDAIPRRVARVEDIKDAGDAATYVWETLAENAPSIASLVVPGMVGARVAALAGAGAKAVQATGWTSAFLTDVGLQAGESAETARQAGGTGKEPLVVGAGLGKAMLDFVPFFAIARRMGIGSQIERGVIKSLVDQGFLKRAAGNVLTLAATEVPTEVAQQAIDTSLNDVIKQQPIDFDEEDKSELLNAAAGAAAFSLLGIPAGIFKPREEEAPTPPPGPPPEASVTPATKGDLGQLQLPLQGGHAQVDLFPGGPSDGGIPPDQPSGGSALSGQMRLELPQPLGQVPMFGPDGSILDYKSLYNRKGELRVTASDYRRMLVKSNEAMEYDPTQGSIIYRQPDTQVPNPSGWSPGDVSMQSFYLDGPPESARAQISKNPDGSWSGWLPSGISVGTFPDIQQAMSGTARVASESDIKYFLFDDGLKISKADGHSTLTKLALQNGAKTPIDQAIVAIEGAKNDSIQEPSTVTPQAVASPVTDAQMPAALAKLMAVRHAFMLDKSNFRASDGEMLRGAEQKLGNIDKRIARAAEALGLPNPVQSGGVPVVTKGRIEDVLNDKASNDATEALRPKYPNLSDHESAVLMKLEEKEAFEGLTEKEYGVLEKLISKRKGEGEKFGIYESPTDERLSAFEKAVEQDLSDADLDLDVRISDTGETRFQRLRGVVTGFASAKWWKEKQDPRGFAKEWDFAGGFGKVKRLVTDNGEIQYLVSTKELPPTPVPWTIKQAKDFIEASWARTRGNPNWKNHLTPQQFTEAIQPLYQNLKLKPALSITDVATWSDKRGLMEDSKERREAEGSRALFYASKGGHVTFFVDKIGSAIEAQKTFVHEILAHYGLRAFFEPKELEQILTQVGKTRARDILENSSGRWDLQNQGVNLLTAEEFIANMAERLYSGNPVEPFMATTWDRIVAMVRRAIRRIAPGLTFSDKEMLVMLKDIGTFLRSGQGNRRGGFTPDSFMYSMANKEVMRAVTAPEQGSPIDAKGLVRGLDSFSSIWGAKSAGLFLTPLQIAEKYSFPGVREYIENVQQWWARKRDLTSGPVELAKNWNSLPKREMSRLSQAIFEITNASDEAGRKLTEEEKSKIFREAGVEKAGQDLFVKIQDSFKALLDDLQKGLEITAIRTAVGDKDKALALHSKWKNKREDFLSEVASTLGNLDITERLLTIEGEFKQLRERDYFPYMRFGRYAVTVRAKNDLSFEGKDYKGPDGSSKGEVVYFSTFESQAARKSGLKDILAQFGDSKQYDIGAGIISDEEFTFMGMPPSLFEALRGQLNLSSAQEDLLKEIYFKYSPGRAFLRHLIKRKGINGFSQDALRVFSAYAMNASNHIARVEYHQDMSDSLSTLRTAAQTQGDVAGLTRDYFARHYKYIMNPENDWAGVRSFGFLWYLGFNVKSALVNLTQIPMVAHPFLASRYGDVKSLSALAQSYKDVFKWYKYRTLPDASADAAMTRGVREGFLDESQATELAGLGEAGFLQRMLPQSNIQQRLMQLTQAGSFLFHHAENVNRRTAFLAARRLALEGGASEEAAFVAGRDAVQTAMFEYAKWARPEFMRGKKSVAFLFWNYMQHLSYLGFGGRGSKTAIRLWLGLLAVAGLQGLPFAENVLDLIDWSGTEVRELFGVKDPKLQSRLEIRELMQGLTDNPDLLMHGLSRQYGLGVLHLLGLAGVPVPSTDVSASLSAGRPIPGIDRLTSTESDPDAKLGQTVVDVLGPVSGMGYNFWRALTDQNPDKWKVWERAMPSALGSASKALRRGIRGEESFRGGGAVAKFDPNNLESRLEVIANALGFQPTRVTQAYEQRGFQEDLRRYWTTRRAMVMENYAYGVLSGDPELRADTVDELKQFNQEAPSPQLRVSAQQILSSLRQRTKLANLREQGVPNQRAFVPLYSNVKKGYGAVIGNPSQAGTP